MNAPSCKPKLFATERISSRLSISLPTVSTLQRKSDIMHMKTAKNAAPIARPTLFLFLNRKKGRPCFERQESRIPLLFATGRSFL